VDQEVVREERLVTSRKPDDIPAFNREAIRMFAQAMQQQPQQRHA
jgi:protease I